AFGALQRRMPPSRLLMLGFALQATGAVGLALAPVLPVALALAVPIGFGFALLIPMLNAGLQELSPDRFRGRVMSAFWSDLAENPWHPLPRHLIVGGNLTLNGGRQWIVSFTSGREPDQGRGP
ncbi:MAG: hypothetical protein EBT13_14560, partial [Rhodobacteraceae bacterium]|nr:hypothetical protein [Paracoccaceae bacterium]